jgi:hypothetical protein
LLSATVANAVPLTSLIRGGADASSAPMLNWGPIAFALEIAQPDDVKRLPSEASRAMLARALSLRAEFVEKRRIPPPQYRADRLGINLYDAALPAVQEVLPNGDLAQRGALMADVWKPILRARATEYAAIVWDSFKMATGLGPLKRTRLFESVFDWIALAGILLLCAAGPFKDARATTIATFLVGMHLGHLAVICMFDDPLDRYVYATEIFVVIAMGVLVAHQVGNIARYAIGSSYPAAFIRPETASRSTRNDSSDAVEAGIDSRERH